MTQSTTSTNIVPLDLEKPTVAKAIVAGVGALTTGLTTALADGHVTVWEIVLAVLFTIGTAAGTYATTNKPA
jgi:hypothetical protein